MSATAPATATADAGDATADATATAPAAAPHDYRLRLPAGWQRVVLADDRRRARDVGRLADTVLALGSGRPTRRAEPGSASARWRIRAELARAADAAAASGGVELYVSLDAVGAAPIAASVTTTLLPAAPTAWESDVLARAWRVEAADETDVRLVDLPAGRAVRRLSWRTDRADSPAQTTVRTRLLEFVVPVPGSTGALLLTFATPVEQLADVLIDLFDAVAGTLEWVP